MAGPGREWKGGNREEDDSLGQGPLNTGRNGVLGEMEMNNLATEHFILFFTEI